MFVEAGPRPRESRRRQVRCWFPHCAAVPGSLGLYVASKWVDTEGDRRNLRGLALPFCESGVLDMKKVFTTGQVAKICKVAPRTVSKWFDSGRLRGYRIPGSQDRRIPREHLVRFLKEHGMPLGELESEVYNKVLVVWR